MTHKITFSRCGLLGVEAICSCGWSERTPEPMLSDDVLRHSRLHFQKVDIDVCTKYNEPIRK